MLSPRIATPLFRATLLTSTPEDATEPLRLRDFETKPNNNIVERLNGTFRERMKVMRSLSTGQGATDYVKGMQVYYNYIRGHQGLDGKTPAEMANIPIDLTGNRWQTMIELANQSRSPAMQQKGSAMP